MRRDRARDRAIGGFVGGILFASVTATSAAVRATASARAAMQRMDYATVATPRAVVFGSVRFVDDEGGGEGEGRTLVDGCCATVTCAVGREAHATRTCDGDGRASTGARFRDASTRARGFGFGLDRSIAGTTVTTTVEAEGDACEIVGLDGRETGGETRATVRSTARADAHRAPLDVVVGRRRRARGESPRRPSEEFIVTALCGIVLVVVNVALAAFRRRRERRSIVDAPASAEIVWDELVGERNARLLERILAENAERLEHLSSAEWKITAKAPPIDYAAPRCKTYDLVYDFLTSQPHSIAPTHVNREWDSDAELDDYSNASVNDTVDWCSDGDGNVDHDVFGVPFRLGESYTMTIRGHGDERAAKLALSQIASVKFFQDTRLRFFHDHNEE